ncbi:FAD-dependent thymidylate synthase [Nonomuraea sp. NPDC050556]|uniref:FAD-dependent thymidylate synthase n=1 Tax=Nonomuraea sp. NPDC050556 TaxID=3364369 RepID=UPI00378D9626
MTPEVHLIAKTTFDRNTFQGLTGFLSDIGAKDADALAEAAGRNCYQSWDRPNPKTSTNQGYITQAIHEHQHWSIAEHASATFLIRGLSRAGLAQLTRHRMLSFSVISQRYVDHTGTKPVIPQAIEQAGLDYLVQEAYDDLLALYDYIVIQLNRQGFTRKQAREAARAVPPEAAPVRLVVTGNMRAWHEVLTKRHHTSADQEAQNLATELLVHLCKIAPNAFADVPDAAYGNDQNRRAKENS